MSDPYVITLHADQFVLHEAKECFNAARSIFLAFLY